MAKDSLQQFTQLRATLEQERTQIQQRLQQIDSALGGDGAGIRIPSKAAPKRGPRASNDLTIREAIAKVTASKPLNVVDIVKAVQKIGYKFTTENPANSVGAFLYGYGKKHFKRANGKFSALK